MNAHSKKKPVPKGPRALAKTIKKTEVVSVLANRSLNHSRNRYVDGLRSNNNKLAHFLTLEKKKTSHFYQKYLESEAVLMAQKGLLRNISYSVKTAVGKFKGALDSMIEASTIMTAINDKIVSFCPELADIPAHSYTPNNTVGNRVSSQSCQSPQTIATLNPQVTVSTVENSSLNKGGVPIRHCAAKPMVQGQVISHPTVSLERVVIPSSNSVNGTSSAITLSALKTKVKSSGLSPVPEEGNPSHEDSDLQSADLSSSDLLEPSRNSLNSPTMSLPESHVLVERLDPNLSYSPARFSNSGDSLDTSVDQLTVVNFGSLHFDTMLNCASLSPRKSPAASKKSVTEKQETSPSSSTLKQGSNSSASDEYVSESSSEDENLALQLVESKRNYLGSSFQTDSKEGTSWNYDEAGKFRAKPPRRKRFLKKKSSSRILDSSDDLSLGKRKCTNQVTESSPDKSPSPAKKGRVQSLTPKSSEDQHFESKVQASKQLLEQPVRLSSPSHESHNNLEDHSSYFSDTTLDVTSLDVQDMSLTECIKLPPGGNRAAARVLQQEDLTTAGNLVGERNEPQSSTCDDALHGNRNINVTQRSRGRKQNPDVLDLGCDKETGRSKPQVSVDNQSRIKGLSKGRNCENSPPISLSGFSIINKEEKTAQLCENLPYVSLRKSRSANIVMRDKDLSVRSLEASKNAQSLSPIPSYVVLERLPSNIMSGNYVHSASSNCDDVSKVKRMRNAKSECESVADPHITDIKVFESENIQAKPRDTNSSRKRNFVESSQRGDGNESVSENYMHQPKSTADPNKPETSVSESESVQANPRETYSGRKRNFTKASQLDDINDPDNENYVCKPKSKQQAKKSSRSKETTRKDRDRKKLEDPTDEGLLAGQVTTNAESGSPTPSTSSRSSENAERDCGAISTRRKPATSYKEPSLHTKLRRP